MAEKLFPTQTSDEKIIIFTRKHWLIFFGTILILLIMLFVPLIGLAILYSYFPEMFSGSMINVLVIFGTSYLLFLGTIFLISFIDFYFDIAILTDRRVVDINQKKLFNREIDELDLLHIEDTSCKIKGILATLFDYGDVEIQTAGTARNFIFNKIPHPRRFCRKVMEAVDKFSETEKGSKKIDVIRHIEGLHPIHKVDKSPQKENHESFQKPTSSENPPNYSPKIEGELQEGKTIKIPETKNNEK